ncbi:hypothetical protein [Halomicrococcus gelatinilyticus]|uniref:hypothetical protein n=1 Tax=Halomicrococcus gelatinilyticus TaxID=1702103 RepID=UPI002E0E8FF1
MRKIITIIASLMLVSTVFAGGAMAHSGSSSDGGEDGTEVEVEQEADAEVEQTQVVSQKNTIDDQWGVAASVDLGDGSSGDSTVSNVNVQTNNNQQVAEVEAENEIEYEG